MAMMGMTVYLNAGALAEMNKLAVEAGIFNAMNDVALQLTGQLPEVLIDEAEYDDEVTPSGQYSFAINNGARNRPIVTVRQHGTKRNPKISINW